ncbi:MAG: class I SAM-dependent methyltransferase [Chloroflexi bacterium]|nr:class I SAM-dependent methyltransferase [Chloroflexota bacterium]
MTDDEPLYRSAAGYDLRYSHGSNADVGFWCALRRRLGARRVLELGCGTGRLTLPLAADGLADGVSVVGLDRALAMLAGARAKLVAAPPAVRAAVRLFGGDMRDFALAAAFDLVCIPFNTLGHLHTIDEQRACLTAATRHLAPGGRVVVAVEQPALADLAAAAEPSPNLAFDSAAVDPASSDRLVRYRRQTYARDTQTLVTHFVDERLTPAGDLIIEESDLRLHVYTPRELALLFALSSLTVTATYGDYDFAPLSAASSHLILVGASDAPATPPVATAC